MANVFTITTTATDTIKTDAKGHAEAVFTVTNTSPRPVRGMATVTPLDSAKQEWLRITGDQDRDFAAGGTQQFVVTFDAPVAPAPAAGAPTPGTPATGAALADKYGFRLVVALATNPFEQFTQGQPVRVEVPNTPPPPPPPPSRKWIFILIGVVVLIVVGVVIWRIASGPKEPEKYAVPDVATLSEADARQGLETGCKAGKACVVVQVSQVPDKTAPKDTAIRTEPAAGTEVLVASNVTLFMSSGPEQPSATPTPTPETYKLPAVANQLEAKAKETLAGKCKTMDPCVQVEVNRVTDNKVAGGMVVRIEPQEGTEVNVGSKVTMFVSKGPDKVTILAVANLPVDTARDKLGKSCGADDCLDIQATIIADNNVPSGRVIRTDPAAGTVVSVGSKLNMFVSGGTDQVMIPSVRNRTLADARSVLENACKPAPCLKIVQTNQNNDLIASGRAIATNPLFGMVKIGSSVVLFVSNGPELKLVGNYVGMTEKQARQRIVSDGFTVGTVQRTPMFLMPARVNSQTPAAGGKQPKGSKINIHVVGSL